MDGDFRVEACSASATSSTQTSASLCPYQHYAHLHCPIHFRLPTLSSTMHHTSSQKGLRSGWQSGASEPHLLTRRCSNRRKFCGLSAPIAYATSGIFCEEAGAMVAAGQVIDYANVIRSTISSAKSAQAQEVLRCDYSIFLHLKAQDIYKKSKQSAPSVLQINQSV